MEGPVRDTNFLRFVFATVCKRFEKSSEVDVCKELSVCKSWRMCSLTDLILQKLLRVKQIEDNAGHTLVSEGIDANYQDMINYAIFALIHLNES